MLGKNRFGAVILGVCVAAAGAADDMLPLLFKTDFETGGLDGWKTTDPKIWKIVDSAAGKALALTGVAKYEPKVRSPYSYALVQELTVTDFVLDVRMKSTSRAEPHQDLCLVFGYQDLEHFYYVHLGRRADPHAHSVFLVNNQPRVSIAKERTEGTPWTDGWHHVRLQRTVETGAIAVYFDDMDKPIMKTVDKTFTWGKIGLGSFDNTGLFDDLVIHGRKHTGKQGS